MTRAAEPSHGRRLRTATVLAAGLAASMVRADVPALDPAILPYLVECALPEGEAVTLSHAGQVLHLSGSLGLAPEWRDRPLTDREQRWLSACLLARTNLHGRRVEISLRSEPPAPADLTASAEERRVFPVFEGGFFGNLFAEQPIAFVCGPDRQGAEAAELGDRLCTLRPNGGDLTMCSFTHVGPCQPPNGTPVIYAFVRGAP